MSSFGPIGWATIWQNPNSHWLLDGYLHGAHSMPPGELGFYSAWHNRSKSYLVTAEKNYGQWCGGTTGKKPGHLGYDQICQNSGNELFINVHSRPLAVLQFPCKTTRLHSSFAFLKFNVQHLPVQPPILRYNASGTFFARFIAVGCPRRWIHAASPLLPTPPTDCSPGSDQRQQ